MVKLFVHDDAKQDLAELVRTKKLETAAKITALLEQLDADEDLLDRLTQHGFGDEGGALFNVSQWFEQQHQGNNLWRVKHWDLERKGLKYRIIYAFVPLKQHYYILGILPREFNYEPEHELTKRILEAYGEI